MTFISYRDREEVQAGGFKADAEKTRTDLLPPDVMMEVSEVLTFGANKYAPRNWEKGMGYGRLIGATLRHVFAIMRGEDRDPETGLLHAAHAICCLMFLCGFQLRGMKQFDDRNKLVVPAERERDQSWVDAKLNQAFGPCTCDACSKAATQGPWT